MKDIFVRAPLWMMDERPVNIKPRTGSGREPTISRVRRMKTRGTVRMSRRKPPMKRQICIILKQVICALLILCLCGCWDARELDELGIVMGVGFTSSMKKIPARCR
jgi:hypothetical protein